MKNRIRLYFLLIAALLGSTLCAAQDSRLHAKEASKEDKLKAMALIDSIYAGKRGITHEKAFNNATEALDFSQKISYKRGIAICYGIMGSIKKEMGSYDESLVLFNKGLKFREETKDSVGIANAFNNIGRVYMNKGDFANALDFYFKSLDIYKKMNDRDRAADEQSNIGIVYFQKGDLDKALDYHLQALTIRKAINDSSRVAISLTNLGMVCANKGDFVQALDFFFQALIICEEKGDTKVMADIYSNIGSAYYERKDFDHSLEFFSKAVPLHEARGTKSSIAILYRNMGNIYVMKGNVDSALYFHNKSLALTEEIGDKHNTAYLSYTIGTFYKDKGDYERAIYFLSRGLKMNEEIGSEQAEGESDIGIGNAYLKRSRLPGTNRDSAMAYIEKARLIGKSGLNISSKIGARLLVKDAYSLLSQCDSAAAAITTDPSAAGTYWKSAFEYHRLYTVTNDQLFTEEGNKLMAEMKAKYETETRDRELKLLEKDVALQKAMLGQKRLDSIDSRIKIELLNKDNEIQQLVINKSKDELDEQKLIAKSESDKITLLNKEKVIRNQEIQSKKNFQFFLITGFIGLLITLALLFNRFKLKKKIERQQALMEERSRISNAMHDDIGSDLSKIAFLSEAMMRNKSQDHAKKQLETISGAARGAIAKTREIVWSINPQNDTLENLAVYLRQYTAEYLEHTDIDFKFNMPHNFRHIKIKGELRRNVFLIVKEALHNVMKHAEATEVTFTMKESKGYFELSIHDNGKGIDLQNLTPFSNGMTSMKHRAEQAGGHFIVENGNGTAVKFGVKLEG